MKKLSESQKGEILGDEQRHTVITRHGVEVRANGSLLYIIHGPWMSAFIGKPVIYMADGNEKDLFWCFDHTGKKFLGVAKKVLPVRAMSSPRPAAPEKIDLKKIEINCLMKICARKDIVIEQQAKMIEALEKKLFLALNKAHPMQRRKA